MPSAENKGIAKNTVYLYLRMIVVLLISLYTSRKILEVLGVTQFGVWSLVFTVISSLSFMTAPLATSTQRFINVELAHNENEKVREVFKTSFFIFSILSLFLLFLFETVGLWFVNYKLEIPIEYKGQANIVYQCAIISFLTILFRLPFEALIISHERFNFIAIIGIIDAVFKLGIVYLLLVFSSVPHLALLGFLTTFVSILIGIAYVIAAKRKYAKFIDFGIPRNKVLRKEIISFSGWNTFGVFAVMTSNQGLGIVVNLFYGVLINAAIGVTNQIQNAVNNLVNSFQQAFQPQIVKRYAAGEKEQFLSLLQLGSKISFLLVFFVGCPLIFNIEFILSLWLKNVPALSNIFAIYVILTIWVETIGGPFWMAIHASGKIKSYQIAIGLSLILTIILSYIFLKLGYKPQVIFQVKLSVSVIVLGVRILFMRKDAEVPIRWVIKKIILPILIVGIIGVAIMTCIKKFLFTTPLSDLILGTLLFLLIMSLISYYLILNRNQRQTLNDIVRSKISH